MRSKVKVNLIDVALGKRPADIVLKNAGILDLFGGSEVYADIAISGSSIAAVGENYGGLREIDCSDKWVIPGFIDAHIHIESTMMTPFRFERIALSKGVTTAICDPHEIANVLGEEGIRYFLKCAERMRLDLYIMLPSCVPASPLETSGHRLTAAILKKFESHPRVLGLAEMMNFPGVLSKIPDILAKLAAFDGKMIDGHAPLLRGRSLDAYIASGVRSCHESISADEVREKIQKGMVTLLREGSVAKNLSALLPAVTPDSALRCCFASDDRNPASLLEEGYLEAACRKALGAGQRPLDVYRMACLSPALAYGLRDRGAVAPGLKADLVILDSLQDCRINSVLKNGRPFRESSQPDPVKPPKKNTIRIRMPKQSDFVIKGESGKYRVIEVIPNEIVTRAAVADLTSQDGVISSNPELDILKIAVVERHGALRKPSVGLVRGFGINGGAIASSVGHDSHNVVVIGSEDADMMTAVLHVKKMAGGFCVVEGSTVTAALPLPIAGLMSTQPPEVIREQQKRILDACHRLGCRLQDPFLQMAFLVLSVIPELKITDRGIVDVEGFKIVPLRTE